MRKRDSETEATSTRLYIYISLKNCRIYRQKWSVEKAYNADELYRWEQKKLTYDFGLPCRKEASEWMLIMSVCDFGKRKEVVY